MSPLPVQCQIPQTWEVLQSKQKLDVLQRTWSIKELVKPEWRQAHKNPTKSSLQSKFMGGSCSYRPWFSQGMLRLSWERKLSAFLFHSRSFHKLFYPGFLFSVSLLSCRLLLGSLGLPDVTRVRGAGHVLCVFALQVCSIGALLINLQSWNNSAVSSTLNKQRKKTSTSFWTSVQVKLGSS